MRELPLVLFTVLSQAAVGLVAVSALLLMLLGPERAKGLSGALRNAGRLAFPLAIAAVLASFAHLGNPMGGFRAFTNLGSSWMSREVLLMVLFCAGAAAYFALWQWRANDLGTIKLTGSVTTLIGLVTIYVTGMVYQLPTRPEWMHWSNLAAGFVTAFLLGALLLAVLALPSPDVTPECRRLLGLTALAAALLLVVSLAFYAPYLASISGSAVATLFGSPWFWVRILLGLAIPLLAVAQLMRGIQPSTTLTLVALVTAVGGELIGRSLFYESVLSQLPLF